jgi:hypothetical protein
MERAAQKNTHAVALGRLGGLTGKGKCSPAKASAARRNGLLGGRPPGSGTQRAPEEKPARVTSP